jgi:hypothetical protein
MPEKLQWLGRILDLDAKGFINMESMPIAAGLLDQIQAKYINRKVAWKPQSHMQPCI